VQGAAEQRIIQVTNDVAVLDLDEYDGGPYLNLPERPVTAVSTVLIGATAVTDYSTQLRRNRLWRAYGWRSTLVYYPSQPSTVTVTYTHGYAAGDQKLQLARGAVFALAGVAYDNPNGATSEQIDDYAVRYEAAAARLEASPALKEALRRQYGRPAGSVRLIKAR
jgi:CRP-like cAMP-binding protein